MLLVPELNQQFRKPRALPEPAVNPRVASGAKRNEQLFLMNAGESVMDRQAGAVRLSCPTAFAAAPVAREDGLAVPIEVMPGVSVSPVALFAKAGDRGHRLTTLAKQNFLPGLHKPAAEREPAGGNVPGSLDVG